MWFVIWSFEHEAWWGRGERGYTTELDEAGWYRAADAERIVQRANLVTVNEQAIPLAEALDFVPAPSIACPRYRRRSFNVHDIAQRYCGACHRFLDDEDPALRPGTRQE